MLKSTLIEILSSFTEEELKNFGDFVTSPYHNKKSNVERFYLQVKPFFPIREGNGSLEKEKLWIRLFPEKPYNYGVMKNLIHDLTRLAEEFIKLERYKNSQIRNDYDLCYALYSRNLSRVLDSKYNAFEKKYTEKYYTQSQMPVEEYLIALADFYSIKAFTRLIYSPNPDARKELIKEADFNLFGIMIRALRSMPNFMVMKSFSKHKSPEGNILLDFLNYLTPEFFERHFAEASGKYPVAYTLIRCYYMMFLSLVNPNEVKYYFDFKTAVKEASAIASKDDFRSLVRCLTVCLSGLPRDYIDIVREMFDINIIMLQNNIFLEDNGFLKELHFNKFIWYAAACGEIEAARSFIKQYSAKLPPESTLSCTYYANAEISFAEKDYNISIENIVKSEPVYFDMKLSLKSLMMMNYFELNDYDSFLYQIDSARHFVKDHKVLENRRIDHFKDFYSFINSLFFHKLGKSDMPIEKLEMDIKNSYPIRKVWLMKKIAEMKSAAQRKL